MDPATISAALLIIQEVIKLEPAIAAEIHIMSLKPDATPEEWDALRARIQVRFETLCPNSAAQIEAADALLMPTMGNLITDLTGKGALVDLIPPVAPVVQAAEPSKRVGMNFETEGVFAQ